MPPLTGVKLPTRIVILANEMPSFRDPSGALERRLIVLRTRRSFLGEEDVSLTDALLRELPGILNWAIEGRQRLYSRGRFEPKQVLIDPERIIHNLPTTQKIHRIVIEYERDACSRKRAGRRARTNKRGWRKPK